MGQRAKAEDAKQVACLIQDAGHMWMDYHDRLPAAVRRRLAESRHNICAACLTLEAKRRAATPNIATFLRVLAEIEHQIDASSA
jgi:hypothetical protein